MTMPAGEYRFAMVPVAGDSELAVSQQLGPAVVAQPAGDRLRRQIQRGKRLSSSYLDASRDIP